MRVMFLLANFLVPELYFYSMFHIILILHHGSFHDLNSCFLYLTFGSIFRATNFESPSNSYYFVDLNFFHFLVCFRLNPYSLRCLNLHFFASKRHRDPYLFKKSFFFEFCHLQKRMFLIKPNQSRYFSYIFLFQIFYYP